MAKNVPPRLLSSTGRIRTVPYFKPTSTVVNHFVDSEYTLDHWKGVAKRAQDLCLEGIKKAKENLEVIEAKVDFRAKDKESLREKLKMRDEEMKLNGGPGYEKSQQIWDEIADLAGVRIILYMPSEDQRAMVEKMIQGIWGKHVKPKVHDGTRTKPAEDGEQKDAQSSKNYRPIHLGYRAEHYRVPMLTSHSTSDTYDYEYRDKVEIQVTSALGHAWAQAGHDVLYKTYAFGQPTLPEQRILDALNGIALSGDLLLEQFYELFIERTSKPFETIHELGTFLANLDILQNPQCGRLDLELDVLLLFLKAEKKNSPLELRNSIRDLGFPHEPILDSLKDDFFPAFEPRESLLGMICLIYQTISKFSDKDLKEYVSSTRKCKVMVHALHMLHEFSPKPDGASDHLQKMFGAGLMSEQERDSLDYVITDPYVQNILSSEKVDVVEELESAWKWFQGRAREPSCICGLIFRLADKGIVKHPDPIDAWEGVRISLKEELVEAD